MRRARTVRIETGVNTNVGNRANMTAICRFDTSQFKEHIGERLILQVDDLRLPLRLDTNKMLCFARDNFECLVCGTIGTWFILFENRGADGQIKNHTLSLHFADDLDSIMTIDHIIPRSKFVEQCGTIVGMNAIGNYQTLCRTCNCQKGNQLKDLHQMRAEYRLYGQILPK